MTTKPRRRSKYVARLDLAARSLMLLERELKVIAEKHTKEIGK